MIAPSFGRLVRASWQHNASAIEACPVAASRAVASKRPISGHQRRHSSSKTPIAGDGVKVVGRAQRPQDERGEGTEAYSAPLRSMGRRRRRQDAQPKLSETFSNLPSVPPTSHLDARDVGIASFFSQHRPISITSSLPTPTTSRAFESIFDPSKQSHSRDSIESTRLKMRQILMSFRNSEAASKAHLSGTAEAPDAIHLDGLPPTPQNLDQVLQGASFRPPPPPEPGMPGFGARLVEDNTEEMEAQDIFSTSRSARRSYKQKIQRKSWSTTIIVTETTDNMTGGKSYATANTPIIQIPIRPSPMTTPSSSLQDPYTEHPPQEREVRWRQPFLQRMYLRQRAFAERLGEEQQQENAMLLISVKRQRKLKMKKHKYKKLMRRTRNLRRKLGRD